MCGRPLESGETIHVAELTASLLSMLQPGNSLGTDFDEPRFLPIVKPTFSGPIQRFNNLTDSSSCRLTYRLENDPNSCLRHAWDRSSDGSTSWRILNGLNSHFDQAILAIMKKASITEAKNNLSALIDSVKGGSPVLIVDRGRPVARLEPVSGGRPDDDSRLARLVRDGVVRPARRGAPKDLFATKPPRLKKGASGVRALLEERRDGR